MRPPCHTHYLPRLLLLSLCLSAVGVVQGVVTPEYHDYVVVGAGPGGLQMGHFLQKAARDYIVLERSNVSGHFYTKYPRHDKLISINKRHTGKTNAEFNLRHDWNSLLSDDATLLYKHYSREMFPPRETMPRYLDDFQRRLSINVRHNVEVHDIRATGALRNTGSNTAANTGAPSNTGTNTDALSNTAANTDALSNTAANTDDAASHKQYCHPGWGSANKNCEPQEVDNHHENGYQGDGNYGDDISVQQHIYGQPTGHSNTQSTHKARPAESNSNRARFIFTDQNNKIYTCRTLIVATGLATPNVPSFTGANHVEGYEDVSTDPEDFEGQSVLILGRGNAAFEVADRIYGATNLIHMIGRSRVRLSWATHYVGDLRAVNNGLLDTYQLKSLDGVLEAPVEGIQIVKRREKLYLDLAVSETNEGDGEAEIYDNFALREGYDRVIRCLGFTFDKSIFSNETLFSRGEERRKKYPLISHDYQSADVTGLYYAGTVTHSLDHRFSSGGFIHGFRYTTRALHRLLEWDNHRVPWPCTKSPTSQLLNTLLKRINEASGPYQMFGVLGDVVLIHREAKTFELCEEFPARLVAEFPQRTGRSAEEIIVVMLEYGPNFSGPGKDIFRLDRATGEPSEAHKSNFLHPVFYHYRQLPTNEDMLDLGPKQPLPRPDAIHHVVEDFLTHWDAPSSHIMPLRRFLENVFRRDMRHFHADSCFQMLLTYGSVPFSCQEHYLKSHNSSTISLRLPKPSTPPILAPHSAPTSETTKLS